MQLPSDYIEYLENGTGVATTAGAPGYFQLWHPDDVEEMNRGYCVEEFAPGLVGFGSDGGGEMLAFDRSGAVFMVPFVGMSSKAATQIALSWSEVVSRIVE